MSNRITQLRETLNFALDNIIHLERGLALCCAAVTDPDQRTELLKAKTHILHALDLEGAEPKTGRWVASVSCKR